MNDGVRELLVIEKQLHTVLEAVQAEMRRICEHEKTTTYINAGSMSVVCDACRKDIKSSFKVGDLIIQRHEFITSPHLEPLDIPGVVVGGPREWSGITQGGYHWEIEIPHPHAPGQTVRTWVPESELRCR